MRRLWLYGKKEKRQRDITAMAIVAIAFAYVFFREHWLYVLAAIAILVFYARKDTKKEFSNRNTGLSIEDKESGWLADILDRKGIEIKRSVKMKYGDIDIYVPSLDTVIDVKGYRKVDDRIASPNNMNSIRRQMRYAKAKTGIFWLPYATPRGIVRHGEDLYIVSGRKKILELLGAD